MGELMVSYIAFLIAFSISFASVPLVMALANNRGVIAVPGARHTHSRPTPKLGGIAIALGVLVIAPFIFPFDRFIASYLAGAAVMLALGITDDFRGANWSVKLTYSVIATSIMIFGADLWIRDLGNLFGTGDIHLGLWGIPFTYFAVFGVVNAINLIDGLNGLACGTASIAFIAFAVFGSVRGNSDVLYLSLANLGATLGLFRYNYPRARIFMGDSGSLFLGFSLAIIAMLLTQGSNSVNPMVPVTVLAIPIFDALRVLYIRLRHKRHPFQADKTHMHHLMIRSGIPLYRVVKIMWLLTALMSTLAFVLYSFDEWLLLLILCIVMALTGIFIESLPIIRISSRRR